MTTKQRKFKLTEENTRKWGGKSSALCSTMKNNDIKRAIENCDWSEMIEKSKAGLNRSKYNKENNIQNPASYDKFMNVNRKKYDFKKKVA